MKKNFIDQWYAPIVIVLVGFVGLLTTMWVITWMFHFYITALPWPKGF